MKKALFSTFILVSLCVTLSAAQAQTRDVRAAGSQQQSSTFDANNQEQSANHTSAPAPEGVTSGSDAPSKAVRRVTITSLPAESPSVEKPVVDSAATTPASAIPVPVVTTPAVATPAAVTSIYRVGAGDVLDIQLLNAPIRESTLYSVLDGGVLEYPLAGESIRILGLTTEEIGKILTSKIKIYDKPQITIAVREYASHNVIVTGLVRDPGTKALRREAVPLFVVLAEAQPRSDAARAIIMRPGSPTQTIDISDTSATSVLIYPNDVIRLVAPLPPAPLYFYIIGQVVTPGQRDFHPGMTLTQSIFASGGATQSAGSKAKVMRQGADGRLATTEYNLKRIEQGKDPDPQIEAGDRIEIGRSGW